MIPSSRKVRTFNPPDIYEAHVRGRQVVYLDNNFWIKLTDQKTQDSRDCLAACKKAIQRRAVIFPTSFASISELFRQPPNAPRDAQAKLMDELSECVTFRSDLMIERLETEIAFEFFIGGNPRAVDRTQLFTYAMDYVGDSCLNLPASLDDTAIGAIVDYLRRTTDFRSLEWILKHRDPSEYEQSRLRDTSEFVARFGERVKMNAEHFRSERKLNPRRVRHEERCQLFNSKIMPGFDVLFLERYGAPNAEAAKSRAVREFSAQNGKGGPELLEKLFSFMPSIELFAQLMAAMTLHDGRRIRPQDFWDVLHACVPACYANVFATEDRGLVDLLTSRSTVPTRHGCQIVRSQRQLVDLLTVMTGQM